MAKRLVARSNEGDFNLDQSLHPVIEQIYLNRGVRDTAELDRSLQTLIPYHGIKDIDRCVALLSQALEYQWRVVIVGDFDADGATSTALSVLALREFGINDVHYLVPNRFEFGYGLSPEIAALAVAKQPDLIITVDNGISSIEGVQYARSKGVRVLITDHHLPPQTLPEADAIVNPNQQGCEFIGKALAGVGVMFYVLLAFRAHLRQRGIFKLLNRSEPNLAQYLDLVALGTVADVVPLDRLNRVLVHQGLARIRQRQCRPGILALLEVAGRQPQRIVAGDLGFAIGPRLNAAGRLEDMSLGIACLLSNQPSEARQYAETLDNLNQDRRSIEQDMQNEAMAIMAKLDQSALPYGITLFNGDWHQGVIGILASRIKDRHHRPVVVFTADGVSTSAATSGDDENESERLIKGSARSVPGFHIRDGLEAIATQYPNMIKTFGGHAMAAGLTIVEAEFERFANAFDQQVQQHLSPQQLQGEIQTDGQLPVMDFTLQFAQLIRDSGPWGQAFPEPVFEGEFELIQQRIVGQKHLKMVLRSDQSPYPEIDAIAFNVDLAQWPNEARQVKLAFRLDVNEFRGRQDLQLMVEYLEPL